MRIHHTRPIAFAALCLAAIFGCAKALTVSAPGAETTQAVLFSSEEGIERLDRSNHKTDFFKIAPQFESQPNRIVCGPTTVAIVLNALRDDLLRTDRLRVAPDLSRLGSTHRKYLDSQRTYLYNRYTPENVFDVTYRGKNVTPPLKTKMQVFGEPMPQTGAADWGFQLCQLHDLFLAHGAHSDLRVVSDTTAADEVRSEIVKNLAHGADYVVINYQKEVLGQPKGGHISPLGAYDEASDSALIMDVRPDKGDWVWVPMNDLIAAMRTFDTSENRGYLLVSETIP